MRYFPAFVDVGGQAIVVVGGGEKAQQKLRLLVKTEARITVVAEAFTDELRELAAAHDLALIPAAFMPIHLDGARLAFAASDDARIDMAVSAAATARGIAVNVVDRPEASTFIVPALVDRDPIVVAIGSEGSAPVLARDIRARIEALLPFRLGRVARRASALRERLRLAVPDPWLRRRLWDGLLTGPWRDSILAGDEAKATRQLENDIQAATTPAAAMGRVSLVGAGPGDPDLLTLRAQQRLQEADVIVIDGLVPDAILEHARRDAKRIHAGKEGYGIATDQGEINRILVREAAKGQRVVRLKGGDPFIFGRAAEEMVAVRAAGIAVDVVPGITAAHACAANIGLPLTLREKVRQFSVVTGATGSGLPELDWRALARPGHVFAIYMGVRNAPAIAARLLAEGAKPSLSVVLVENGTRPDERVIETTLGELGEAVRVLSIEGPAVIFVGLGWDAAHLSRPAHVERFADHSPASQGHDKCVRAWTPEEIALTTHWVAG